MKLIFAPQAFEDLEYWQKTGNAIILKRVELLLTAIPIFTGFTIADSHFTIVEE
jgi:Txe/YoeB family toxin of Txe-Axe toxin-antitoxin module